MGGFASAHQFVKIGPHVMAQAFSIILQDVPPYVLIGGNPIGTHGINSEGLKRRDFSADTIAALKRAYKTLYRSKLTLEEARAELEQQASETPEVKLLADFIAASTRGILR
jgi:UDP-N-acetylglucosamine acyltransferase